MKRHNEFIGQNIRVYDNGGKTADRYAVIYMEWPSSHIYGVNGCYEGVTMSEEPFHPQGICQHGPIKPGRHLGKRIKYDALPVDCRIVVEKDIMDKE